MKIRNKRELLKQLETIKDFRTDRHKIEYALGEVLFMSIFGLLSNQLKLMSYSIPNPSSSFLMCSNRLSNDK